MMRGLDEALPGLLPAFLQRQRWFGGKTKAIVACDVEDTADLGSSPDVAVVVSGVSYADGARERYGLLLTNLADAGALPTLGQLDSLKGDWLVEATADPRAAAALLRGFTRGATIPTRRGGALRYADASEATARMLAGGTPAVSAVGAEQSNSSFRIGPTLLLKLFRRLPPGENPELEVGRFLTTRTSFRAMSTLEGSLTYLSPAGESSTLGVLQTWLDHEGDGWGYVLSALDAYLRTGASPPGLTADLTSLGAITADLHAALESDARVEAFRPEPILPRDIASWSDQVRTRASRAFALVETQLASWPDDTRRLGASVLAQAHLGSTIVSTPDAVSSGAFARIRIHGDYHLGQVLKTRAGFAIIDFEGEPASPVVDRRQKQCPLKDVAGMLRSFDYAASAVLLGYAEAGPIRPEDRESLLPWAAFWTRWVSAAFLRSYLEKASEAPLLPPDGGQLATLLSTFLLEKAFYELGYELQNRPEWIRVPLEGIERILEPARASKGGEA